MFFQVSHKIKYVAFICLVFVTSSVTSNDTSQIKYDVFVSFRGEDVRRGFLSHLIEAFSQKQIAFFVDDSILKGEELSEALFGAIEESYISLVIFSENYASSRWCLSELEKIMECRRKNGQTVVPIFYKVDPSDIRHQRRTYGDAFIKHERNYSLATVQTWRSALSESANLSGFDLSKFPSVFCSLSWFEISKEKFYFKQNLLCLQKGIFVLVFVCLSLGLPLSYIQLCLILF